MANPGDPLTGSKLSSPIMITDDKKSILERVNFFVCFFSFDLTHMSDNPLDKL